jgi:hypothetical protein
VSSQYQQRGPGVWSGVKIFFGGCIVLPILLFLFFVSCTVLFGSGGGN